MSQYTLVTNYAAKDSLISGNPAKLIKGADFTTEFTAVQAAVNSKVDGSVQFFPDGTVAQPSVGFTNNGGTGMYQAAGVLSFATNAIQRISVAVAGNVVVNAPASGVALAVSGNSSTSAIQIVPSGGQTGVLVNPASGASYMSFALNSVTKADMGVAGSAGAIISGSAAGDWCVRSNSAALRFSVDNGASNAVAIGAAGNVVINGPASGTALTVSSASGAANAVFAAPTGQPAVVTYSANNGSSVGSIGVSGSASGLLTGDVAGDIALRSAGAINFAGGGALSKAVTIDSSGNLNVPNGAGAGSLSPVYAGIPQNLQTTNYTLVLADANKHLFINTAGTHTFTIPANASVAFPIGTAITIINGGGSGVLTLAITSDTLAWYPSAATGSRSLAPSSSATFIKVLSTAWILTGVGIT